MNTYTPHQTVTIEVKAQAKAEQARDGMSHVDYVALLSKVKALG